MKVDVRRGCEGGCEERVRVDVRGCEGGCEERV